jgi:CheY-like chemotaxis protein
MRYIEGRIPGDIMNRLSLGKSQYYRDLSVVLDALVDTLWEELQEHRSIVKSNGDTTTREELITLQTERLRDQASWESLNIANFLRELEPLVEPLARATDTTILIVQPQTEVRIFADRVMLRQAVLNIIPYVALLTSEGEITISDFAGDGNSGIHITVSGEDILTPDAVSVDTTQEGIAIARHLIEAMQGHLEIQESCRGMWIARLAWPVSPPNQLLVVDDNEGLIDLFERYLVGHHWQVIGALNANQAREIIAENQPTVIALDVMMPEEDGWDLLLSLKAEQATQNIPVIVCSVLGSTKLAEELGAVATLPKPVSQRALINALAPWRRNATQESVQ